MMVVVAITGVLVTMAYWGMSGVVPGYRLSTAARDVSEVLILTRARAIAQNRYYIVEFQANAYRVIWDQDGDGVIDAGESVTQTAQYGQGVSYQRPTTTPLPAGDIVLFDPRGTASNVTGNGQNVQLRNGSGVTREVQVRYSGLVKKL
jgi:Tfp pilus assembly protein FimT